MSTRAQQRRLRDQRHELKLFVSRVVALRHRNSENNEGAMLRSREAISRTSATREHPPYSLNRDRSGCVRSLPMIIYARTYTYVRCRRSMLLRHNINTVYKSRSTMRTEN